MTPVRKPLVSAIRQPCVEYPCATEATPGIIGKQGAIPSADRYPEPVHILQSRARAVSQLTKKCLARKAQGLRES